MLLKLNLGLFALLGKKDPTAQLQAEFSVMVNMLRKLRGFDSGTQVLAAIQIARSPDEARKFLTGLGFTDGEALVILSLRLIGEAFQ